MAKLPIQKMKKNPFFIIILLLCAFDVNSKGYEDYNIEDIYIPEEYLGTYLPVDYLTLLKSYKSHEKAMNELRNTHYTVIMPTSEGCFSDLRYCDRYAAKLQNVKKWEFKTQNDIQIIKDENGFEYKKISDKPFAYTAIANYILTSLFSGYVSNDFKIDDNYLIINNSLYKLHLNPSYTQESIAVSLQNKTSSYFIRFTDTKLQLVKGKKIDAMQFDPTDEVIYECNIIK